MEDQPDVQTAFESQGSPTKGREDAAMLELKAASDAREVQLKMKISELKSLVQKLESNNKEPPNPKPNLNPNPNPDVNPEVSCSEVGGEYRGL